MLRLSLFLFFIAIFDTQAEIVIDKSCYDDPDLFKLVNTPSSKDYIYSIPSPEIMLENLKANLVLATHSVTWCEFKYPMIKPYTRNWRMASDSIKVICKPQEENPIATAMFNRNPLNHLLGIGPLGELTLYGPQTKPALIEVSNKPNRFVIRSLIHELFHGSGIDHNKKHDKLDKNDDQSCKNTERLDEDRVYLLDSLCSGSDEFLNAKEAIFNRISQCGIKYCENIFTSHHSFLTLLDNFHTLQRSSGMSEKDAQKICKVIYHKGACQMIKDAIKDEEEIPIVNDAAFSKLKKMLREDLQKLPSQTYLPISVINSDPASRAGFKVYQNSKCMTELFDVDSKGLTCKIRPYTLEACYKSSPKGQCFFNSLKGMNSLLRPFIRGLNDWDNEEIQEFLEKGEYAPLLAILKMVDNPTVKNVIGKKRYKQYKRMIAKLYPADCELLTDLELKNLVEAFSGLPTELQIRPDTTLLGCPTNAFNQ